MDDEDRAIEGASHPELIRTRLRSRDQGWRVADGMRTELHLRQREDHQEGRDFKRFDGVPHPNAVEDAELERERRKSGINERSE